MDTGIKNPLISLQVSIEMGHREHLAVETAKLVHFMKSNLCLENGFEDAAVAD